eukprot:TRINITY_DN3418_c0_g1_i3.p1 TRINITY_DN3418_c0_g1~~TRINITY_DN3418_c0_g1_i3.p1  ORF type:complete len:314 (-),score=46.59 TRINITY_DN3418_c0_g1_i3:119-1060(-)
MSKMEQIEEHLKLFDFFPKLRDDALHRSSLSGMVTLLCSIFMSYLMISEIMAYVAIDVTSEVGVDLEVGVKLPIYFNFSLPGLNCEGFGLDFIDNAGDLQLEVMDNIRKVPQRPAGRDGVRGCNAFGKLLTNKVSGDFHIAFGRQAVATDDARSHIHRFTPQELDTFNASHIIEKLAFGEEVPGVPNPLDGATHIVDHDSAQFQYHLQVIPTRYVHLGGFITVSNQYTFTLQSFVVNTRARTFKQPGIFFKYELSPYQITYREHREPFSTFIASVCAILGGVYVVGGWMSGAVRKSKPLMKPRTSRRASLLVK